MKNLKIKKISNNPEIVKGVIKNQIEAIALIGLITLILLFFLFLNWISSSGVEQKEKIMEARSAPRLPVIQSKSAQQIADQIIMCESENKQSAVGDLNYIYPAYGVAQFQVRTFNWLSKLANKKLDINNSEHQRELLIWAIENNYGSLWTCWKKIGFFEKL